jgi:Ca2+-binding RTX toxin-like protein
MRKLLAGSGVGLASVVVGLLSPATASAALQCSYSAHDHVLAVTDNGIGTGEIVRSGSQIVLRESPFDGPPRCDGAPPEGPTVFNTDQVHFTLERFSGIYIEMSGGPFAPGAIDEGDGSSEIEFQAQVRGGILNVVGRSERDVITWGTDGGLNLNPGLNGDVDSDVAISGQFSILVAEAAGGPDLVAPQAGFVGFPGVFSEGGRGNDILRSATYGGILDGGRGRDTLLGGKGTDYIIGGGGRDRIRAGKKSDLIGAVDGRAETVFCGGGRDKGKADRVDKLRGCEQVRRVDRRRASSSSTPNDTRAERQMRRWTRLRY